MQPLPLGRYLLTEPLAVGGTAEIFKAKLLGIEGFEKTVVIKRILPHWSANAHFISMLIDEAKIMVRLNHERIVQVYELGKDDQIYYIVMEYVAGDDLRKFAEKAKKSGKPLTSSEALFIISEVLKGLDYIHKQKDENGRNLSIVHRDISPQNILISEQGAVKITDFGIAHAASRSYETATGVLKGKFAYMSPEQARGSLLDPRTDIFATGVILFELLTGRRLFSGGSDLEVLDRVKNFDVVEIDRDPLIDKRLKPLLKKALNPQMKERYAQAYDFWKDLQNAAQSLPSHSGAEALAQRFQKTESSLKSRTEKKGPPSSFPSSLGQGNAIVSSPIFSVTDSEETRSLSEIPWGKKEKPFQSRVLKHWALWAGLLGLTASVLGVFYFRSGPKIDSSPARLEIVKSPAPVDWNIPTDEAALALNAPESQGNQEGSPPKNPSLTTQGRERNQEELKTDKKTAEEKKKKEDKLKIEREKLIAMKKFENKETTASTEETGSDLPTPVKPGLGTLSVRASPWGKISISGVVSGSEHPVSKNLNYGNYTVSVSYQNIAGEWKTVSRAVKVAKASTICTAAFRPDGQGSIACH